MCFGVNGEDMNDKHRHHFIQDLVEDKVVSLKFVPIEGQITNILTKPLDISQLESLRSSIGLYNLN